MKKKETEQKKQLTAEEFTWDDTYEPDSHKEPEELFETKKEKLDLIYPDPVPAPAAEESEPRKRQNSRRIRKSYKKGMLIALAVLCVVVAAGLFFSSSFAEMLRYNTSYTLWESGEKLDLAAENTRISGVLGGLILSGGADGISAYREDQSMVWNISYTMSNPVLEVSDKYALVMDLGGKLAIVCDAEGLVYQAVTQYSILSGSMNESGWITLIAENTLEHEILVYSGDGAQILRRVTSGSDDGHPMAAVLSDDGRCLITAYTAYNSNKLSGKVTFFDLSVSGGVYTDRISANFVYQDIVLTDLYTDGTRCIAVGDNRMIGYDFSATPSETWNYALTNRIEALDFGSGFVGVIYGEELSHTENSLENQLILYNMQGGEIYRKTLENPSYLQISADLIIYGEGRSYVCVDTKGRSRWFYNALEDVQAFYSLEEGKKVVRVSASNIQVMNIVGAEKTEE